MRIERYNLQEIAQNAPVIHAPEYATTYALIEPNYGHAIVGDFTYGDSQHP
jgi:hypothetical protein